MQAMQVDEALEHADEWIEGVTLYEGAQGWCVACATLAAEVRRLRKLATCGCGDSFTEHDPGTCGNCLAGQDRTCEVDSLRSLVGALLGMIDEHDQLATGRHSREWSAWLCEARKLMGSNVEVTGLRGFLRRSG